MSSTELVAGDGTVVAIYFTLKDEHGTVLETNRRGGKPMAFLHGAGNVLPALERALAGKKKNDHVEVELAPADAYGEKKSEAVHAMPRKAFPAEVEIRPGMRFNGRDADGRAHSVLVTAVEGDEITVDENHPLAGKKLRFEITVYGVRPATDEERQHGHPHGPGGAHHH